MKPTDKQKKTAPPPPKARPKAGEKIPGTVPVRFSAMSLTPPIPQRHI